MTSRLIRMFKCGPCLFRFHRPITPMMAGGLLASRLQLFRSGCSSTGDSADCADSRRPAVWSAIAARTAHGQMGVLHM
ncbi:hypothetical protein L227DRAFT_227285 [Lentinus tigrinus ALCF2SS1-6]|uniref:Uncharacterized protein n=1 Tax=Lentinus tigrinus ALCF2SS1-6 TaxID=1328759 RepID=A0A5C2S2F1_9APHY|nr:hypothetical protein L227DRAFT_227285 [Lentinus tigrinus ALCF2SS1-6]